MKAARLVVLVSRLLAGGAAALLAGRARRAAAAARPAARSTPSRSSSPRSIQLGQAVGARTSLADLAGPRQARASSASPSALTRSRSFRRDRAQPVRRGRADARSKLIKARTAATWPPSCRKGMRAVSTEISPGNRRRRLHPAQRPRRRDPDAPRPRGRKPAGDGNPYQRDDPAEHPRARDRPDARREGRPEGRDRQDRDARARRRARPRCSRCRASSARCRSRCAASPTPTIADDADERRPTNRRGSASIRCASASPRMTTPNDRTEG